MTRDRASLAEILERIELAIEFAGSDRDRFQVARVNQEAVIRQLEIVGEAAKRLTYGTRSRADTVPWASMIGFKNVAVHQYDSIDLDRVWEIVRRDLPRIRTRVRATLRELSDG